MNRRCMGDRIRQCRLHRRLSERELADRSGVSRDIISQVEGGSYKKIKGRILWMLARALRVRCGAFLDN